MFVDKKLALRAAVRRLAAEYRVMPEERVSTAFRKILDRVDELEQDAVQVDQEILDLASSYGAIVQGTLTQHVRGFASMADAQEFVAKVLETGKNSTARAYLNKKKEINVVL